MDFAEPVTSMPVVHGGRMSEALIMTGGGIEKARTMRRLPVVDRWVKDDWEDLSGVPWAWKPVRARLPGASPIPVSDSPPPPAGVYLSVA